MTFRFIYLCVTSLFFLFLIKKSYLKNIASLVLFKNDFKSKYLLKISTANLYYYFQKDFFECNIIRKITK
jgi:hypothetical protein